MVCQTSTSSAHMDGVWVSDKADNANLLFGGITLEHCRHADLHTQRLRRCSLKLVSPCPLASRLQAVSVVVSCGSYIMLVLHHAVM
jgi:hypothetical protein